MTSITVPGLPFPLDAAGAPPSRHKIGDDALTLTSGPRSDMFVDPAGSDGPLPDAGRFVGTPPDGDFTLAALVTVDFRSVFDAGVLIVHAGERRWAKHCFEYSPGRRPTAVSVVTRDTSDDCNSFEVDGNRLWMRVTRTGRAWAFHASADGAHWRMTRYFSLADDAARVGFLAQSPTGDGVTATFENITFRPGAPADLRDGS